MKKNLFLNRKFQTVYQTADLNVGSTSVWNWVLVIWNWVLVIWNVLANFGQILKSKTLLIIPLFLLFYSGCDLFKGSSGYEPATEEKQFVWNGLNAWYYWQSSVPNLADNRFSDDEAFHNYMNGFSDEEGLFNSLLHAEDDFSWFIEDYEEHLRSRQGISTSFGFRYGLVRMSENSNDLFGYVQYVLPGAPADEAALKRGDIFTRINGTRLTAGNYQGLLNSNSYSLTLAVPSGSGFEETGEAGPMQAQELQEDPVYLYNVIETETAKVGYLVLNAFRFNYHQELNNAFGFLKNEQIDELVIDLRYNSGGALVTSAILAGMISGLDEDHEFARLVYNEKRSGQNLSFPFYDEVPIYDGDGNFIQDVDMHQLHLDRLFVVTGYQTASASETLINGLLPFMDVVVIGNKTRGKDEGSITVFDNPPDYNNRNGANPNHLRAMQPIVFKIFNNQNQDYPNGFFPSSENELIEYSSSLLPFMTELGDKTEPLLARALDLITGASQLAKMAPPGWDSHELIMDSASLNPFHDDMYLLPGDLERFSVPFK